MDRIECFDIVSEVVGESAKRFSPLWKTSEEKYNILKQYCEVLDRLAEEFNGVSFEVEVDEITMEISITLECQDEIIIKDSNHVLYKLAKRSVKYSFCVSEEGNLLVKFVFPSVWEK